MTSLAELFPAGDYRFHLTLRRGAPGDFFRATDQSGRVLAERRRWLTAEPARHAALEPGGEPLLEQFARCLAEWQPSEPRSRSGAYGPADHKAWLLELGATLEPDFLLLSADEDGAFRLRGGVLCFPTAWALQEKMGHPLDVIHAPVPGLNAALAGPVQQFLTRLKPGTAYLRDNWGVAATDALNLHPALKRPSPGRPVALDRLWLRVEHQALVALPTVKGVLFAVRIALHRLDEIAADQEVAAGLRRALNTMPPEVRAYKRLDEIWTDLSAALA